MQSIADFVRNISVQWGIYLGGIVVLSAFSMAILQTAKDLFPIRRIFHRSQLRRWFDARCGAGVNRAKAETDLVRLATDGEANAFFDLATEQLCGQMSAAAQVVLEFPQEHAALLNCLTKETPVDSRNLLTSVKGPLSHRFETLKQSASKQQSTELEDLATAKLRMMHQIQRSIDAFQISALYRWKTGFQFASFVLSVAIAILATEGGFAHRVLIGFVAGFLAPIARDLQAKLQQIK
jgi:hypothetical protein